METGEIYVVDFPASVTHEQQGTRPAVIVIDFPDLPVSQVIPLTTSEKAKTYKNTVVIQPDAENNLNKTSVAMLFQLRAIDKGRLKNKIGKLSEKDMQTIRDALKKMFSL